MLKPSKRHFILYDAQTYEKSGFIKVAGKVQQLAQKPRFWQVTATPITTDGKQLDRTHIKFKTPNRVKLSELKELALNYARILKDGHTLPKHKMIYILEALANG